MTLWFAALLGIVQGLTEFLPISSTAHLRIVPALLGRPDAGAAFTAVIQLGTLAATIVYFARDLVGMIRAAVTAPASREARLLWYLGAGTVPIGVLGLLLKKHITGDFRSLIVVASALIVVGVVMAWADRRDAGARTMDDLSLRDALLIGLGQACALVPGVSRSGSTITAALLLGLARPDAARFSFLLSIPAVGAAGVFELKDAAADLGPTGLAPLVLATVVSGVVGYGAIAWLLRFLRTRSLVGFAVYRVLLGAALFALVAAGVMAR
jgi:undecaprenyl-diphosphatase